MLYNDDEMPEKLRLYNNPMEKQPGEIDYVAHIDATHLNDLLAADAERERMREQIRKFEEDKKAMLKKDDVPSEPQIIDNQPEIYVEKSTKKLPITNSEKYEKFLKFEKHLKDLNQCIVCNDIIAKKLKESSLFEEYKGSDKDLAVILNDTPETRTYIAGKFNKMFVTINPMLQSGNLRIFNLDNREIMNLNKLGFKESDLTLTIT